MNPNTNHQPRPNPEERQTGGDQTDELFINNPDHPLKVTEPGNQVEDIDHVKGQDRPARQNPANDYPDDNERAE